MNATFGVVLRKVERWAVLRLLPPNTQSLAEETVEVGPQRFSFPGLDEVEFEIHPVTEFIRLRLPTAERGAELEYAWMTGRGLDAYQAWARDAGPTTPAHSFERAFQALLGQLGFWAVMLAPETDRLEQFISVRANDMTQLLRRNVGDLRSSRGFLAVRFQP